MHAGGFFLQGLSAVADSSKAAVSSVAKAFKPSGAQLRALFERFDTDGSEYIDSDELLAALLVGGKSVSKEECLEILSSMDTDQDGKISFDEFVFIFEQAPDALPIGVAQLVNVSAKVLEGFTNAQEWVKAKLNL